jgi:arsenate reductase
MPTTLYGFKSCDTVKKARAWLESNGVEHEFFDYRVKPLDPKTVDGWFKRAGWQAVFNRNSTTFKELPEAEKAGIDEAKAKKMILAETNLIKRPVLDTGDQLLFGFKADAYAGITNITND